MGNCLDIPPPPPKPKPRYFSKPRYFVATPTPSITSGSIRSSASHAGYSPYPGYGRPVPQHMLTMEAVGSQAYNYQLGAPIVGQSYFPDSPMLANGSYAFYEDGETRESRHKRRHRRHERRIENGGVHDRNGNVQMKDANRNSTIITTFPDPQDDVIKRGHEIVVNINAPRSDNNGVIATITSGAIRTSTETTTTTRTVASRADVARSSDSEGLTVNNQEVVVQSHVTNAPVATRGSTYITYIQEEPQPEPQVQEEITVEESTEVVEVTQTSATTRQQTVEQQLEVETEEQIVGFRETGEADEGVVQLFIDVNEEQSRQTTGGRTTYVTSDWLRGSSVNYTSSPADVALTYAPGDVETMLVIKARLEAAGLKVAVSSLGFGEAEGNMTDWLFFPQAIVDARMLVVLLSPESVNSQHIREEVALAHLTDTSIFPVALAEPVILLDNMDLSLKLQLASYQWTELMGQESVDIRVDYLVRSITEELELFRSYEIIDEDYGEVSSWAQRRQKMIRTRQLKRYVDLSIKESAVQYWDKVYASGEEGIAWDRFYQDLRREYKELLRSSVPIHSTPYLMEALKRDIGLDHEGRVLKTRFLEFCMENGTDQDLWEKIRSVARETQAIHDVLDVNSSVRAVAIQNLAKFGNTNVLRALCDLLNDPDPNVRAVTCVSVSRVVWAGDRETLSALMATLDDDHALVREAGCQAMGRLKVKQAQEKLQQRCNDVSSDVREAAAAALNEIGQREIDDVIRTIHDVSEESEIEEVEDVRL